MNLFVFLLVACCVIVPALSFNPKRIGIPSYAFKENKSKPSTPASASTPAKPAASKSGGGLFGGLLGGGGKSKATAASSSSKISAIAAECIALYRKELKSSTRTDAELNGAFLTISKTLSSEESAALCCRTTPTLLNAQLDRITGNFAVYTEKFGEEKAKGMVERNPGLLFIPTRGYGSAEVAGEDAMAMSYVIAATRPAGKFLLAGLFLALGKAIIFGVNV